MKLLILNHNVIGHGGYIRAYNYGRQLSARGHIVSLITISEKKQMRFERIMQDGLEIIKSPDFLWGRLRSGWDPWDTFLRILYTLPKQYDLVHCVDSRPVVILPALSSKYKNKTTFIIDWGDWWGRGGTIYERKGNMLDLLFAPVETYFEEAFLTKANGVTVLTRALEKRALSLGVERNQLIKMNHGADTENLKPIKRPLARNILGLDLKTPIVGYLGVIMKKDGELLINSFKEVLKHHSDAKLFIIGNSNLLPDYSLMESDSIFYTGRISYEKLNLYLAACDVTVLPLLNTIANAGRWPSKVCDYMAAGCPIVTTHVGDMAYLFAGGKKGVLTKDDSQLFAHGIMQVLKDEDLKSELGKKARKYAEEFLDWKILAKKLEKFYLRIM